MSDLWINIRFGLYHLQIGPRGVEFNRNDYHIGFPHGVFKIYKFLWWDNV